MASVHLGIRMMKACIDFWDDVATTGAVINYKVGRLPHAAMISAPGLRSRTAHELQGYSL
jgi:hypothetical protein